MPEFKDRDLRHIHLRADAPASSPPLPEIAQRTWKDLFALWSGGLASEASEARVLVEPQTAVPLEPTRELIETLASWRHGLGEGGLHTMPRAAAFEQSRRRSLGDILDMLTSRPDLRAATLAAADRSVAPPVRPKSPATPAGIAMWRASERHAATLYRRSRSASAAPDDPAVTRALERSGEGQPLPAGLRTRMERELGVSFGRVRIHTDGLAAGAAGAVAAEAFTVGDDVFFSAGAFDPTSEVGRALIAHELTHVAQAWHGRTRKPDRGIEVSQPSDPLEREAEDVAQRAAAAPMGDRVDGPVRRRAVGAAPHVSRAVLESLVADSRGEPLPLALRGQLEDRLGDLGEVRVHSDTAADRAATLLAADAFAVGHDIYFARGAYDPSSKPGQHLIAHEVAHTLQQGSSSRGEALEVSSPGDTHERQADEIADAVMAPEPTPIAVTPAAFTGVSRHPSTGPAIRGPSGRFLIPIDDVQLFPFDTYSKKFLDVDTKVPLAKGIFPVGEIPVTYNAEAGMSAHASAFASYGPGLLHGLIVELSTAEALGHDIADPDPIIGVYPLGPFGPKVGFGPSPRDVYDKIILGSSHTAAGQASAKATASLSASAGVSVSGGVDALDIFGGGVTGGITATATAVASATADAAASMSYAGGVATVSSLKLSGAFEIGWDLALSAYAGIYVELKMPDIPVITSLMHEVSSWPVIGWVVPDPEKLHWKKDFTKSWDLYSKTGAKKWTKDWSIVADGASPSATHPMAMIDDGFDLGALVKEELAGKTPAKDIPKKDDGPDKELKDGASASAVAGTRQAAKAQVKSARDDIKRELTWNKKELAKAHEAVTKAAAKAKSATASAKPPALAIGSGGKPPEEQYEDALQDRASTLANADVGAQNVDKKIDEVQGAAENRPEGPARNQARQGYEKLGENADKLGQAVGGYGEQAEKFKRPVSPTAIENADTAEAERARLDARRVLDESAEKFNTELIRVDKEWQDATGIPELASYTTKIDGYRADIKIQCARPVETLNKDWADVPSTWPEPKDQTTYYRDHLIKDANALVVKFDALVAKVPEQPWDTKWAVLENRKLMLIPSHRDSRPIRNTMYPDYKKGTKTWLASKLELRVGPVTGKQEWYYSEATPVSEGTGEPHWWLYDGPDNEKPTIAHDHPSVGNHWNANGRLVTQSERGDFMNGTNGVGKDDDGKRDKNLGIEPKRVNSQKANQLGVKLVPEVGVKFRGPGGR